jgi:1,4-dihydroxy-2-naphthoate octaprenyltransferase
MGKRFLDWIVFSNVFITVCAVVMVIQTDWLLLQSKHNLHYLGFVFFASLCSYNFHWWLTTHSVIRSPRVEWTLKNRNFLLALAIIGLLGAAFFFYFLLPYWTGLLATAVATFLYSAPKIPHPWFRALRRVALGKTIFLSFVWTSVTTILPVWISGHDWTTATWLFVISRYFMIYAICILFDYRDKEDDKKEGVKSLVTYLDEKNIYILFFLSVMVYWVATFLMLQTGVPAHIILVLFLPGIISAALYRYAVTHFSDFLYYVILDGMMALPSFITLFLYGAELFK